MCDSIHRRVTHAQMAGVGRSLRTFLRYADTVGSVVEHEGIEGFAS